MQIETAVRNALADLLSDRLDGGSLEIATDGTFATILATFTLPNPFSGAASSGTVTASSISNVTASNTGNAEAYRYKNSGGTVQALGTGASAVTATGGGGEIVLNQATTAITSGQTVSISSCTFTVPAGSA